MYRSASVASRKVICAASAILALLALVIVAQTGTRSARAQADTAPAVASGLPATVSADPLPTVQTDGVVWATATVGNTTFATGNFNYVRPPGMAATANHAGQTQVGGLVAFNTATGLQIPLATLRPPTLNSAGYALAVSPDGKTVYVGGTFTEVNGLSTDANGNTAYTGVAAFSAATGALISGFTANVPGTIKALAATSTALYVGGSFSTTGAVPHKNLIALDAATGQPTLWPAQTNDTVWAMVMTPDQTKLVVGGSFASLSDVALAANGKTIVTTNTTTARGLGALNASTGRPVPWAANAKIQDYGDGAAIDTLSSDGTNIYAGGYAFQSTTENFEGRVAMNPSTGAIIWADSCYGDTYTVLPTVTWSQTIPLIWAVGSTSADTVVGVAGNGAVVAPADDPPPSTWTATIATAATTPTTATSDVPVTIRYRVKPTEAMILPNHLNQTLGVEHTSGLAISRTVPR